jgi:hypothetical protein
LGLVIAPKEQSGQWKLTSAACPDIVAKQLHGGIRTAQRLPTTNLDIADNLIGRDGLVQRAAELHNQLGVAFALFTKQIVLLLRKPARGDASCAY